MKSKKDMHYVSELDKFSKEFNRTHPLSNSQKAEIEKHRRVFELRDMDKTSKEEKQKEQ